LQGCGCCICTTDCAAIFWLFGTQTYRSESEIGKKWERNINEKKNVCEKEKRKRQRMLEKMKVLNEMKILEK